MGDEGRASLHFTHVSTFDTCLSAVLRAVVLVLFSVVGSGSGSGRDDDVEVEVEVVVVVLCSISTTVVICVCVFFQIL